MKYKGIKLDSLMGYTVRYVSVFAGCMSVMVLIKVRDTYVITLMAILNSL